MSQFFGSFRTDATTFIAPGAILALVIGVAVLVGIQMDRRGQNGVLWTLLCILTGPVGWAIALGLFALRAPGQDNRSSDDRPGF